MMPKEPAAALSVRRQLNRFRSIDDYMFSRLVSVGVTPRANRAKRAMTPEVPALVEFAAAPAFARSEICIRRETRRRTIGGFPFCSCEASAERRAE
jgi:hypothetical protein